MQELFKLIEERLKTMKKVTQLLVRLKSNSAKKVLRKGQIFQLYKIFAQFKRQERLSIAREEVLLKHISNQVTLEAANFGYFFNKSLDVMQSLSPSFKYETVTPINDLDLEEILKLYKTFFMMIGLYSKVNLIGVNKRNLQISFFAIWLTEISRNYLKQYQDKVSRFFNLSFKNKPIMMHKKLSQKVQSLQISSKPLILVPKGLKSKHLQNFIQVAIEIVDTQPKKFKTMTDITSDENFKQGTKLEDAK